MLLLSLFSAPPSISRSILAYEGIQSQQFVLPCKAQGLPDPKYEFTKVSVSNWLRSKFARMLLSNPWNWFSISIMVIDDSSCRSVYEILCKTFLLSFPKGKCMIELRERIDEWGKNIHVKIDFEKIFLWDNNLSIIQPQCLALLTASKNASTYFLEIAQYGG